MSKKYTTNFLEDTNGSTGSANQVLVSTSAGIDWVDGSGSSIIGGPYLPLSAGSSYPLTNNLYFSAAASYIFGGDDEMLAGQDGSGYYYATGNGQNLTKPVFIGDNNSYIRFNSGNSERMRITSSGNVGIGTTSPTKKLHVAGDTLIEASGTGQTLLLERSNGQPTIKAGTTNNGHLILDSNAGHIYLNNYVNKNIYMVNGGGNVGIGTTSPGVKLDVSGQIRSNDSFLLQSGTTAIGSIRNQGGALDIRGDSTRDVSIGSVTSPQALFVEGTNGNVGIGTTSPLYKLAVEGSVAVQDAQNLWIRGGRIGLENTALNNAAYIYNIGASGSSKLNIADSLYVVEAGNVGIGTTSPNRSLHVIGQIAIDNSTSPSGGLLVSPDGNSNKVYSRTGNATSSAHPLDFISGSSTSIRINTSGNVGIGTTSPSVGLQLGQNSTGLTKTAIFNSEGGSEPGLTVQSRTNRAKLKVADNDSVAYVLAEGGRAQFGGTDALSTANITVFNNGNVGIGTTSPGSKLEVSSGAGANGDSILTISADTDNSTSSSSPKIVMSQKGGTKVSVIEMDSSNRTSFSNVDGHYFSGGNVGIGTTSPSKKLHVNSGTVNEAARFESTDVGAFIEFKDSSTTNLPIIGAVGDNFDIRTGGSSSLRVKGDGNVGIGTDSPGSSLEVLKSASSTTISEARISSLVTGGYGGQANLWLRTSPYGSAMLAFGPQVGSSTVASSASGKISYNTFTRVFTVTADSNALLTLGGTNDRVGINQTSPLYTLDVTGDGRFTSAVTATSFINSSDERLKENIEEVCDNNVEVNWKTFNFKTEKEQKRYGVIAQELEKTNPEFVREDSQGFKSVAYIDLLIAKIAELEARIQKLEK